MELTWKVFLIMCKSEENLKRLPLKLCQLHRGKRNKISSWHFHLKWIRHRAGACILTITLQWLCSIGRGKLKDLNSGLCIVAWRWETKPRTLTKHGGLKIICTQVLLKLKVRCTHSNSRTYFMTIYILWADYRTKQMMTEKHITVYSKYPKYNTVHCLTAFILQTL